MVVGSWLKESKGARLSLGLFLLSTVVNFAVLGRLSLFAGSVGRRARVLPELCDLDRRFFHRGDRNYCRGLRSVNTGRVV